MEQAGSAEERGRYVRWLHALSGLENRLKRVASQPLARSSDSSALPAELLRELSDRSGDDLEVQLLSLIRSSRGTASLDEVLVGLYRQFGVIQKRRVVQNKLWRMVRKGRLTKSKAARNEFSLSGSDKPRRRAKR